MSLATTLRRVTAQLARSYGELLTYHARGGTAPDYDPATGRNGAYTKDQALRGIVGPSNPSKGLREGSQAFAERLKVILAAKDLPAGLKPQPGDEVTLEGGRGRWTVATVDPYRVQGVDVGYELEVGR